MLSNALAIERMAGQKVSGASTQVRIHTLRRDQGRVTQGRGTACAQWEELSIWLSQVSGSMTR